MDGNQTRIGCIPRGWKIRNIQSLSKVAVSNGLYKSQEYYGKGPFMIHMTEVFANNVITDQQMPRVELSDKELMKYLLEDGDLVFARRSLKPEGAGDVSIVYPASDMSFESSIIRVRLNEEAYPEFVYNYLKCSFGKAQMMTLVRQVAVSGITGDDLKKFQVPIPPKPEQQKIAQILSTWDKAIEKLEALIAAKQKRKKALMQQLLTGKMRFAEYVKSNEYQKTKFGDIPSEWKYLHIGDVAKQVSQKNTAGDDLPVLSCTKHYGLVDSLKYFGKQIFSENTSTYKIAPRNTFAYAANHIEEGSIGYQNLYDEALISPMDTVFKTLNNVDDAYLYRLLKTELYRHIFEVNTSASVDRRGSLRWNEFAKIKIPVPSMEEQQKIASVPEVSPQNIITKQYIV